MAGAGRLLVPPISWVFAHAALAQAPPPSAFPGQAPAGPPVEIVRWVVDPAEIEPGGTATLRWEAINAYSLAIEPDVGAVATRGSLEVAPPATRTYTLTATGFDGAKSRALTITVAGTTPGVPTRTVSPIAQPIPRLADGKPDLTGVYIGGRDIRVADPGSLLPGAESFAQNRGDDDLGQGVECLPPGVPNAITMPFPLQIIQREDLIAIMYEAYHLFRIIPIGGRLAEYLPPGWMGHSVAHWDGDALVVEVRGFNDKTLVAGYRHTENMAVTERYRRTAFDTIEYEAIVEDPNVFARPVRYAGRLTLHPEWEIGEYFCTENAQDYDELFGE